MRRERFPQSIALLLGACFPLFFPAVREAVAQSTAGGAPPILIPKVQPQGLLGAPAQQWHLRVSFETFDEQGKREDQGTFEKYWAGVNKSKEIFATTAFHRTNYHTGNGPLYTGDAGPIPSKLAKMTSAIQRAWPWSETSSPCIVSPPIQFACSQPILYLGRSMPSDFVGSVEGKVILTAHVESIEALAAGDDAQFVVPADAVRPEIHMVTMKAAPTADGVAPLRITISAGVSESLLQTRTAPVYPTVARAGHVEGTVVLKGRVGTDGRVESLEVISGPPLLQQAALESVRSWIYRPYLLNGAPAPFETTIHVVFSLVKSAQ